MKNFKHRYFNIFFLLLYATIFLACSKKEEDINTLVGDKVSIKMRINNSSYDIPNDIITKSSNTSLDNISEINQEVYLDFNDDFYIKAELKKENTNPKLATLSNRATKDTSDVNLNVQYKVLVFDQEGIYITERDYVRGQESTAEDLMLYGNQLYTFIVYSINSTTSIPQVSFVDNDNKRLQMASISIGGQDDFMYFRKDMNIVGQTDNYIDVIFKHKLSQITTVIDASQTGYNVTSVTASFDKHNSSASIDLATGNVTRNGIVEEVTISFPTTTLDNPIITSIPTIINSSTNGETSLQISSITIGTLSQSNIIPLSNISVTPGLKYTLTLTLIPQDEYLTVSGMSSVKIGGQIWMRHNVGADYSIDPDVDPFVTGLHGNYYQWGRVNVVALPTANSTNSTWVRNNSGQNSWNSGTESIPLKTTADPCPPDFRIPTRTEVQTLLNNVNATNRGPFTTGTAQFTSAKVLTSKRKRSIILTLPAQGFFNVTGSALSNYAPTGINNRGSRGDYLTSSASGTNIWVYSFTNSSISAINLTGNASYRSQSKNIRCIAE